MRKSKGRRAIPWTSQIDAKSKKGQLGARHGSWSTSGKIQNVGIQALLDIVQEILVLSRIEKHRMHLKKKHMPKARESFYRNPYAFTKKLFTATKSGRHSKKYLKLISQRNIQTPEGSPANTNGRHPTIWRARNLFQVKWAPAVWGPRIYLQSPCLLCAGVDWHLLQALHDLPNGPGTARLTSTKSPAGRIPLIRVVLGWWGLDTPGEEFHSSFRQMTLLYVGGKICFVAFSRQMTSSSP